MVNPYESPRFEPESPQVWKRFVRWMREPPPVRSAPEHSLQWLLDSIVGFALILIGFALAGLISGLLPFLRSLAYLTGLCIGCFPFVLWLNYCRTKNFTFGRHLGMLVYVFAAATISGKLNDVVLVPVAIAIVVVFLPLEIALCKIVLAQLPGSSSRTGGLQGPQSMLEPICTVPPRQRW